MAISEDDLQTMAHHLNLIARKYKMKIIIIIIIINFSHLSFG